MNLIDKPGSVYVDLVKLLKDINIKCGITIIDCNLESKNSREELINSLNKKNIDVDILINVF